MQIIHPLYYFTQGERMKNAIIIGGISAVGTGLFIGLQSMLSGKAGNIIGSTNTGFWTNFLGGSLAGLLLLGIGIFRGFDTIKISQPALSITLLAGALGIAIIMGVSFSISRAGVAAGLSTIIWGQLIFSLLADTFGWSGAEPIPLTFSRVAGILFMAAGVLLLMPKK